jgi:hypothetical protein
MAMGTAVVNDDGDSREDEGEVRQACSSLRSAGGKELEGGECQMGAGRNGGPRTLGISLSSGLPSTLHPPAFITMEGGS